MQSLNTQDLAKKLINLPKAQRDWLIKNVAPETVARWARQTPSALKPYKSFKDKVAAKYNGEELSDLAKFEYDSRQSS